MGQYNEAHRGVKLSWDSVGLQHILEQLLVLVKVQVVNWWWEGLARP